MLVEEPAVDERDPDEAPKPDWGKAEADAAEEAAARTEAHAQVTEELCQPLRAPSWPRCET